MSYMFNSSFILQANKEKTNQTKPKQNNMSEVSRKLVQCVQTCYAIIYSEWSRATSNRHISLGLASKNLEDQIIRRQKLREKKDIIRASSGT
jgi:glutaminase